MRPDTFECVSALLRLSKKYEVQHVYDCLYPGLTTMWPRTLEGWERREAASTNAEGIYEPRLTIPHPMYALPSCLASQILTRSRILLARPSISRGPSEP